MANRRESHQPPRKYWIDFLMFVCSYFMGFPEGFSVCSADTWYFFFSSRRKILISNLKNNLSAEIFMQKLFLFLTIFYLRIWVLVFIIIVCVFIISVLFVLSLESCSWACYLWCELNSWTTLNRSENYTVESYGKVFSSKMQ